MDSLAAGSVLVITSLPTRVRGMRAFVMARPADNQLPRREIMEKLIKCLVPFLVLVACGVDSPDVIEAAPSTPSGELEVRSTARADPEAVAAPPSLLSTCAASSPGICSGASIGESCGLGPLWCLPAQDLPDGSTFCICQSFATN
jgi:hypothetical protein